MELLRDQERDVRLNAIEALAATGPDAKSAVPALTRALQDTDERVRKAAADALEKIGK
jgi:HEAT repeat protein